MRVLFLTSRLPFPPVGGDRFRVFHILRSAAEAGHEVHLLSFDTRRRSPSEIAPLEEIAASVEVVPLPRILSVCRAAAALPGRDPLQAAYYRSRRMRTRVQAALARVRPQVAVAHLFRMAPYASPHLGGARARWILDLTDVISAGIERSLPYRRGPDRWVYRVEGPRIRAYESRMSPRFDECWVISEAEAERLRRLAPEAAVRVVPNGFEPDRLRPASSRARARLLFLGNHDVFHNRDAARFLIERVYPLVRARVPHATLAIAGKGSERLRSWAERTAGVTVRGFVDDPNAELALASVFVAPHRFAAGVQNKVLQALASGTPVVTTPAVRSGLEPVPEGILRIADDAAGLADYAARLLEDPESAAALGQLGRGWARSRFGWEASVLALESVHDARGKTPRNATIAVPV